MRARSSAAVLLLACAVARAQTTDPAAPDRAQQLRVLADAAEYVLNHELSLPNFICTQTTQRFEDPSGKENWRSVDLIVERLTYFEHREEYKVFELNGHAVNLSHEELGGATSSGEYGSVLKGIFAPASDAHFAWERFYTLRGRKMHVFSYNVAASKSDYHIVVPHKRLDLVAAYHGLVFVDVDRHAVHRITMHADAIPRNFPVQDVSLALDYAYVRISGEDYLLPLEYELRSRDTGWYLKNDVTFSEYRKFGADSNVRFGEPSESRPDPAPVK